MRTCYPNACRDIVEGELGRQLDPSEVVHHKDGNSHNNNINNLQVMSRSSHISLHHTGRHPSEETRKAMSESHLGKTHTVSEKTRERMSKAMMGNQRGLGHSHTYTKECRQRMSEARLGRHHTEECRRRISEGVKRSLERKKETCEL